MTEEELEALLKGAEDEVRVATFEATYESDCVDCGDRISPGEQAGYIEDADVASCWRCLP